VGVLGRASGLGGFFAAVSDGALALPMVVPLLWDVTHTHTLGGKAKQKEKRGSWEVKGRGMVVGMQVGRAYGMRDVQ
jgi:hypothetical protein